MSPRSPLGKSSRAPQHIHGIGVDLIELRAFLPLLSRPRALEKIFTPAELRASNRRGSKRASFLAKRFAAKEAIIKAWGAKGYYFREISITNASSGAAKATWPRATKAHKVVFISVGATETTAFAAAIIVQKS